MCFLWYKQINIPTIEIETITTQIRIIGSLDLISKTLTDELSINEINNKKLTNDIIIKAISHTDDTLRKQHDSDVAVFSFHIISNKDNSLITVIDGKEYILGEESNSVKKRVCADGVERCDIVVTNTSSTSNERYVVKYDKFIKTYDYNEVVNKAKEYIFNIGGFKKFAEIRGID